MRINFFPARWISAVSRRQRVGANSLKSTSQPPSSISLPRLSPKTIRKVAKVLDGLKLVKVNVIGLDDENRPEMEKRAQKIRQDLSGDGWVRVVVVQEKEQDVSVYLKMDDKGAVQGVTAVVIDGKDDAVFANVVGNIKPEQLAMIGEKFDIKPLEKLKISTDKHEHQHQGNDDADDKSKEKSSQ